MRTCKGTAARGYKRKTAEMEEESSSSSRGFLPAIDTSLHNSVPSPVDSPLRSPSPTPSDSILLSSPNSEKLVPMRSISPDPSWGPNPLASWKPTTPYRRHSVSTVPLPISQRIHISQSALLSSFGSPATTPSPSLVSDKKAPTPSSSGSVRSAPTSSEGSKASYPGHNFTRDTMDWNPQSQPFEQQQQQQRQQRRQYLFGDATQLAAVADSVRFHSHYPSVQATSDQNTEQGQQQQHYSLAPGGWVTSDRTGGSAAAGPSSKPLPVALVLPMSAESDYDGAALYVSMLSQQQQQRYGHPQPHPSSSSMWPASSSSYQMPSSSRRGVVGDQAEDIGTSASGQAQAQGQAQARVQGARDASDESMWNDFVDFG